MVSCSLASRSSRSRGAATVVDTMGALGCVAASGDRVQGPDRAYPSGARRPAARPDPPGCQTMDFFHTWHAGARYAELFEIATDQNGFTTTADVRDQGGTPLVLIDMHRHGHVDRCGPRPVPLSRFPVRAARRADAGDRASRRFGRVAHATWDGQRSLAAPGPRTRSPAMR